MKTKTFDCVEMKRRGAQKLLEKLAGMTKEEQLSFWEKRSNELRKRKLAAGKKPKSV